jgi:hypothetical protein
MNPPWKTQKNSDEFGPRHTNSLWNVNKPWKFSCHSFFSVLHLKEVSQIFKVLANFSAFLLANPFLLPVFKILIKISDYLHWELGGQSC